MTNISIAMATYNGDPFIRRQLDSLARQTLCPYELIVCDDGSTDTTLDIVSEFSRSAPFPVVIVKNPTRLGFTANFFQAARMCQGDLIAFCDQDDEWLPQKLHRVMQFVPESDALLFAHANEWIDKDSNPMGVVYPLDRSYRKNLRLNDFHGHAIVIRRSILEMTSRSLTADNYKEVAGDTEFGHDVLLLEIAIAMKKLFFIPEALVRWRVYSTSNHALTDLIPPPRPNVSFAYWLFPPDLAERYAATALFYHRHANLLSCVLRDLASNGVDNGVASAALTKSMSLLNKRADVMELRARFYGAASRQARIRLMLEGAAMGQYGNAGQGGVRIHNAFRDLIACFLNVKRPLSIS